MCHVSWLCLYHALILLQNSQVFQKLDFVWKNKKKHRLYLICVRLIIEARSCLSYRMFFWHLQTPKWCVHIYPPMQKWPGFGRRSSRVIRLIQTSLEKSALFVCVSLKCLWNTVICFRKAVWLLWSWDFVLLFIFTFEQAQWFWGLSIFSTNHMQTSCTHKWVCVFSKALEWRALLKLHILIGYIQFINGFWPERWLWLFFFFF